MQIKLHQRPDVTLHQNEAFAFGLGSCCFFSHLDTLALSGIPKLEKAIRPSDNVRITTPKIIVDQESFLEAGLASKFLTVSSQWPKLLSRNFALPVLAVLAAPYMVQTLENSA